MSVAIAFLDVAYGDTATVVAGALTQILGCHGRSSDDFEYWVAAPEFGAPVPLFDGNIGRLGKILSTSTRENPGRKFSGDDDNVNRQLECGAHTHRCYPSIE